MNQLTLLIILTTINHLSYVGVRLTVSLYALRLEASPAMVGVLAALFAVLGALTSVSVGRWIDRIGPRKPMLAGMAIMVAGTGLAFFWRDLEALFIVSAVVGAFYNIYFIAQQQLIGDYGHPEDRIANFTRAALGYSAASFLGPLLAGFAIDTLGHPATFALLAMLPLMPLTVIASNKLAVSGMKKKRSAPAGGERPGSVFQLLRDRKLRRIYAVSVLSVATWNIYGFLMPIYGAQIGLSASTIGVIIGSFSLGTVAVRVLMRLLTRRFTPWQLLTIALASASISFIAIPAMAGAPLLILFSFWLGMGMGVSGPLSLTLLHEAAPPERLGELIGLRVMLMNGSQTVVPLLAGAAGATLGLAPVFWALAAVLLGGSYAVRGQWRRPRG